MALNLTPFEQLQELSNEQLSNVVALLFEPAPDLVQIFKDEIKTSNSYIGLIESVRKRLLILLQDNGNIQNSQEILEHIMNAHPRLGAKKVDSQQSQSEQKQLQDDATIAELERLNKEYEAKYGIKYVVFVNGRGRDEIVVDMKKRIADSNVEKEKFTCLNAMCDIALDRHGKLH